MNKDIFKSILKPALISNTTKDRAQFAEIIAQAYTLSTVGFCKTLYGARLLSGQTEFLKSSINKAFDANFADKTGSVKQTAYKLMSIGFIGYWADAKFDITPMSTVSMVTATLGTKVTFPGSPDPFGTNIWLAFSQGYTDRFLDVFAASIIAFQSTVSGNCTGQLANGNPVVGYWTGIF